MPRTRGPEYERKRHEIAGRAMAVFSERGYHSTRMEDIAEALGIGRTTIYWYFPDKEAIFRALFDRHLLVMLETIRSEMAKGRDAAGKLLGFARGEIRYNLEKREFMRIVISIWAEGRDAFQHDFERTARDARAHGLALLADLVATGIRDGELRAVDPAAHAAFLQAVIDGVVYNLMVEPAAFTEAEAVALIDRHVVAPMRASARK